jgi:charged multivesicular body protein 6
MGNTTSKGGSGAKITKQDRAILDLKLQRDKIKQYQKKVQLILDKEHDAARTFLVRGDKERAKTALRRRRYQETILQKTDTQLETLEGLVSNIEFSQIEASVIHGLAQGNAVLKEIHKEMTIESVDKLMEETAEAQAYQREIDEALAGKMTAEDEEAVNAEMALLEREALGLPDVKDTVQDPAKKIDLPSAPTTQPVSAPTEEEEEEVQEPTREALLA